MSQNYFVRFLVLNERYKLFDVPGLRRIQRPSGMLQSVANNDVLKGFFGSDTKSEDDNYPFAKSLN